jgi:hypothetical protein
MDGIETTNPIRFLCNTGYYPSLPASSHIRLTFLRLSAKSNLALSQALFLKTLSQSSRFLKDGLELPWYDFKFWEPKKSFSLQIYYPKLSNERDKTLAVINKLLYNTNI